MKITNRIVHVQADYLLLVVRPPKGWRPKDAEDIPHGGEILSVDYVASYEEARDDLLRCNRLALRHSLNKWAVAQSSGGEL